MRPSRLVVGTAGGAMPVYSVRDGLGQELMYRMNGRDYREFYFGHEELRSGEEDLQILITSERVLVFSLTHQNAGGAGALNAHQAQAGLGPPGAVTGGGSLLRNMTTKQLLTLRHSEVFFDTVELCPVSNSVSNFRS